MCTLHAERVAQVDTVGLRRTKSRSAIFACCLVIVRSQRMSRRRLPESPLSDAGDRNNMFIMSLGTNGEKEKANKRDKSNEDDNVHEPAQATVCAASKQAGIQPRRPTKNGVCKLSPTCVQLQLQTTVAPLLARQG